MEKRQLAALFVSNLCVWVVGNGMLPMLPGYAAELGAPQSVVGLYLAFCYAALAVGALAAAWLGRALGGHRRVLSICAACAIPATLALGYVPGVWALVPLNAALWFFGGTGLALVNVLAGLSAGPEERGRVFGIIALATPLGTLASGLFVGAVVERWGHAALFAVMAGIMVLWLAATRFVAAATSAPDHERQGAGEGAAKAPPSRLDRRFYLLFAAQVLFALASFVGTLGRLLVMGERGFAATAISLTGAITGAISLPISPLAGALSDRIGRRFPAALGYALGIAGLLALAVAAVPWHFYLAATLDGASWALITAISSALAADVLPRRSVDRGMALISATGWIGAIAGMGSAGFAIQHLGPATAFVGAAFLPLASIVLLYRIPARARAAAGAAVS